MCIFIVMNRSKLMTIGNNMHKQHLNNLISFIEIYEY